MAVIINPITKSKSGRSRVKGEATKAGEHARFISTSQMYKAAYLILQYERAMAPESKDWIIVTLSEVYTLLGVFLIAIILNKSPESRQV